MCDQFDDVVAENHNPLSRRSLLGGAAGLTASALVATPLVAASPASATPSPTHIPKRTRTSLVLLGTAGGPIFQTAHRRGTSTAVCYDGKVYIVDLGHGSPERLLEAGLGGAGPQSALKNVRSILFSHLHSDHLTEWPAVYSTIPTNTENGKIAQPIEVFGPGSRGTLPRVFPPARPEPTVVSAPDPTPGIVGMTGYLRHAFANDFNDRMRDSNSVDPNSLFNIHDIDISAHWSVTPDGVPPNLPPGTRIPILVDGPVTITATLVDHHPTAPAFGYRFDTPDGSIVISGDTRPSPNLIDLAHGADFLVHEVIDERWLAEFIATLPPAVGGPLGEHLVSAHTTIEQVGQVAQAAEVKNLVLSHLIPSEIPANRFKPLRKAFAGNVHVGRDLMSFEVQHARR